MAILFPSDGDGLSRNGLFFDPAQNGTKVGWFLVQAGAGSAYHTYRQIGVGTDFTPPFIQIASDDTTPDPF